MTEIPENFLRDVEFLPDGSATNDPKVWLKEWAEYARKEILLGHIKVFDIDGFNPDTGEVPNSYIQDLYFKTRRAH